MVRIHAQFYSAPWNQSHPVSGQVNPNLDLVRFLASAFRGQSGLEVFRDHACFCPLLPSHLWSLPMILLTELHAAFEIISNRNILSVSKVNRDFGPSGNRANGRCQPRKKGYGRKGKTHLSLLPNSTFEGHFRQEA